MSASRPATTPTLQKLETSIRRLPEIMFARPVYRSRAGWAMVPANTHQRVLSSSGIANHRCDGVSSPVSSVSSVSDFDNADEPHDLASPQAA